MAWPSTPSTARAVWSSSAPTALPEELHTDQVLGMKKDETKEFDFEVAEDDEQLADFKGKTIHAEVTVSKVQTQEGLPTLDEEFAKEDRLRHARADARRDRPTRLNSQRERRLPELQGAPLRRGAGKAHRGRDSRVLHQLLPRRGPEGVLQQPAERRHHV